MVAILCQKLDMKMRFKIQIAFYKNISYAVI